jgi:hypothetical protein
MRTTPFSLLIDYEIKFDPNSFMGRSNRQYRIFDDVGRIRATYGFSQNGKMSSEGRWEYNDNGDLEGYTQTRNGNEVSSRVNQLNDNGLITSAIFINSYGGMSKSREYAYEYTFYDSVEVIE